MVFSLHLVYVSTAACISEKKKWVHIGARIFKGQRSSTNHKILLFVSWRNKYAIIEWPLFDAPTSTHCVFTSFMLISVLLLAFLKKKSWVHVSLLSRLGFWFVCERPHRFCFAKPLANFLKGIMLKSFQYEMRAIFTESLIHETFYWSNETHIIHNLKPKIGIEWNFGNKLFSFIYFFHLC